ncbi:MAG: PaaI family thioesterase [Oscillospiraceae bacterium]|nr:PaaI family thioesterase [Oscillospiraceae bacterium]
MIDAMSQEEYYAELLTRVENHPDRFIAKTGIRFLEIAEGYAKGDMPNIPATQNFAGGIHGGALFTLADTISGTAARTHGRPQVVLTVNSTMNYLRLAVPGPVACEARVRKAGRTLTVCEAVITDSEAREVASGTFTFYLAD